MGRKPFEGRAICSCRVGKLVKAKGPTCFSLHYFSQIKLVFGWNQQVLSLVSWIVWEKKHRFILCFWLCSEEDSLYMWQWKESRCIFHVHFSPFSKVSKHYICVNFIRSVFNQTVNCTAASWQRNKLKGQRSFAQLTLKALDTFGNCQRPVFSLGCIHACA